MEKKRLGILEVKQAFFADERFRSLFPELKEDIDKALKDPTCACNRKLYEKFFNYKDRLEKYFPNRLVESMNEKIDRAAQNFWSVINCHIDELENRLRKLPGGRKQLAMTRYMDQVTVVVNELDVVF